MRRHKQARQQSRNVTQRSVRRPLFSFRFFPFGEEILLLL